MKETMTAEQIIRIMPKAELHLHLEGAFTFEFLLNLIGKYGGDPSVSTVEDLKQKFVFRDFPHFIETWFWKNRFFREAVDFEESAYRTLEDLHTQNVIYAEVFFSPWDFEDNNLQAAEITEATLSGVRRAERDFGIRCGLIADIVRDHGPETGIERLDQITPYLSNGLIGIGLGGSEQKFPAELFEDVFQEARNRGFHLTAHAGEAAGPSSVQQAMDVLKVERIGHGVRGVENPLLLEKIRRQQIPLEICITSNIKTGIYPSCVLHPFPAFYDQGVLVTINSDDPSMFGATITDEFMLIHRKLGFEYQDFRKLTLNAVSSAFLPNAEKELYANKVNEFWNSILSR
ncbi:MAG: adenosine deaminase [Calditrichia bacterium]